MQVNVIQTFGLPHSDTRGSSDIGSYPRLFAASHVLLRLAAPRHPPWTLIRLTILFISSLRYKCKNQMGQIRLELMTPALSERCSNQLSYCPKVIQRYRRREGFKHEGYFFVLEGLSPSGPTVLACQPGSVRNPGKAFLSQKGGDPAAPSGTAALLRLHPPHQAYLRHRPPCG